MANYRHVLRISTGTVSGAGTDETVKMYFSVDGIVIGGVVSISGAGGRFENGDDDVLFLDSPISLHAAKRVHLRITNTGTGAADWYCHQVSIERAGWKKSFLVRDWIRAGESYKSYPQYIGQEEGKHTVQFEAVPEGTTVEALDAEVQEKKGK